MVTCGNLTSFLGLSHHFFILLSVFLRLLCRLGRQIPVKHVWGNGLAVMCWMSFPYIIHSEQACGVLMEEKPSYVIYHKLLVLKAKSLYPVVWSWISSSGHLLISEALNEKLYIAFLQIIKQELGKLIKGLFTFIGYKGYVLKVRPNLTTNTL